MSIKILLTSFTVSIFISSISFSLSNDFIRVKILEKRIDKLENDINEDIDDKVESIQDINKLRIETLNTKLELYIVFASILLGLIAFCANFFGKTAIKNKGEEIIKEQAEKYVKSKTEEEINKKLNEEFIKHIIIEKGEPVINNILKQIEADAKAKLKEMTDLREEYLKNLNAVQESKGDFTKNIAKEITDKAKSDLQEFIKSLEKVKETEQYTYEDWLYKGYSEYDKKDYEQAVKSFSKCLELKENDNEALLMRGTSYLDWDKISEAFDDFNYYIDLYKDSDTAYYYRAYIYMKKKDYPRAIEDYESAHKLQSKALDNNCALLEAYLLNGNLEKALSLLKNGYTELTGEDNDRVVYKFLECIIFNINGNEAKDAENELNVLLQKEKLDINWEFEDIIEWLNISKIDSEHKKYIEEKIEVIKKYIENQKR